MSVVYQGKWIFIEERPTCGKVTKEFEVWSIYESTALGLIKWRASWRKYTFYPYSNTHFEEVCMYNIAATGAFFV